MSSEANGLLAAGCESYEGILDAWRITMEANVTRQNVIAATAAASSSTSSSSAGGGVVVGCQSKGGTGSSSDLRNLPLLENVQVSFANMQQQQLQHSPYLPNAGHVFLSGMKQEDEEAYRHHIILQQQQQQHNHGLQKQDGQDDMFQDEQDTTDGFFDSNAPKFEEMMQLSNDCVEIMQVSSIWGILLDNKSDQFVKFFYFEGYAK